MRTISLKDYRHGSQTTIRENLADEGIASRIQPEISQAIDFTETYIKFKGHPIAIREAMCLKVQYPGILRDLTRGDYFAGRRPDNIITYFGGLYWTSFPENNSGVKPAGKQGGYCFNFASAEQFAKNDAERAILEELRAFWEKEYSSAQVLKSWEKDLLKYSISTGQVDYGQSVGFAITLDYNKLLRRGIPGLLEDIAARKRHAEMEGEETGFYDGLHIVMEVLIDVCRYYEKQALHLAAESDDLEKKHWEECARVLNVITVRAPKKSS